MSNTGTLYFFCGKMAAGKSTLALQLAQEHSGVLLSEDEWLGQLFPGLINSLSDYLEYSSRLKPLIQTPVEALLKSGTPVVLDFPANTRQQREWFREIFTNSNAPHRLVFVNTPNEQCLEQLKQRRISTPERAQFDTPEVFHRLIEYFDPPHPSEGFNIEETRPSN